MGLRLFGAASIAVVASLVPAGVGSAATVGDSASVTVTLDGPGTLTLDAFDPALGTLTSVEVLLRANVLVQVCIENTNPAAGSATQGVVHGSLVAEFPGGVSPVAGSGGAADGGQPAPSNGSADCAAGYDAALGHFPGEVTAADTVFWEGRDELTNGATLTDSGAMAPFVGPGTVEVAFTGGNDSDLELPDDWDSVVVAQGQLLAEVTYTYTPGGGGTPSPTVSPPGTPLPVTGSSSNEIVGVAGLAVLLGLAAVLAARRRRVEHTLGDVSDHRRTLGGWHGVVGLLMVTSTAVTSPGLELSPRQAPSVASSTTSTEPTTTTTEAPSTTEATSTTETSTTTTELTSTTEATSTTETSSTTSTTEPTSTSSTSSSTTSTVTSTSTSTTTTTVPPLDDDDVDALVPLPDTGEVRRITFPVVGGGAFGYGWMSCQDPCVRFHKGTDIMAAKLQPLVSPVDGVVVRFLDHPTAGRGIVIRGDDGYEYRLYHLNNDSPGTDDGRGGHEWSFGEGLVAGARVLAGELVGFVGDSGNAEFYLPHVHVEIRRPDGMLINPYWSLLEAERGELHCAAAAEIDDEWLRVVGVFVSPTGFRPADDSVCLPDLEVSALAVAALSAAGAAVGVADDAVGGARPVRSRRRHVERGHGHGGGRRQRPGGGHQPHIGGQGDDRAARRDGVGGRTRGRRAGGDGRRIRGRRRSGRASRSGFSLGGTGGGEQVITDPAVLASFVGTGTVTFDVTGACERRRPRSGDMAQSRRRRRHGDGVDRVRLHPVGRHHHDDVAVDDHHDATDHAAAGADHHDDPQRPADGGQRRHCDGGRGRCGDGDRRVDQ